MKKVLLLILSIVALISALFIGATAAASADDGFPKSQTFYLGSAVDPLSGYSIMVKGNSSLVSGSVTIPKKVGANNGVKYWIANEAALTDVTFPDGTWLITGFTDANWSSNFGLQIGYWDPVSLKVTYFDVKVNMTNFGSVDAGGTVFKWIYEIVSQTGSETIPEGDYLVIQISNSSSKPHTVYTSGSSNLASPNSDPGYPLPEIAAGVLLGGGLVGLVGYIAIRKKKAAAAI
jgi:hypothetical protein